MSKSILNAIKSANIFSRFFNKPDSNPADHINTIGGGMERLFNSLFPGEQYSAFKNGKLLKKLKNVSKDLEDMIEEQQREQQRESKRNSKPSRPDLDFSLYQRRYVALQLFYIGHQYDGFARQDSTPHTIEAHLFAALVKTRLIPADYNWKELKYSRAGRTDKGVSALGQVVALLVRSSAKVGQAEFAESEEIDYPTALNKVLPEDIRVLGWTTVPDNFSARFSAQYREYKYIIVDSGQLDVEKMRHAAAALVGQHDFRNFCKPDVEQVRTFERRILDIKLEYVEDFGTSKLLQFYVRGTAFLYHQVRCMVAVLLMVGRGEEDLSIVTQLLDIEETPRKPQYCMASDEPLILSGCGYADIDFQRNAINYECTHRLLRQRMDSHLTRAGLVKIIQEKLWADAVPPRAEGARKKIRHVPLMSRCTEPTIDERLEALEEKRAAAAAAASAALTGAAAQG